MRLLLWSGTLAYPGDPPADAGTLVLGQEQDCIGGCLSSSQSLDGAFDEVAGYDRALTAAEIGAIAAPCLP